MRVAYLAADRPDISETVKTLSMAMAFPSSGHLALLKRLTRYLIGVPRMAIEYPTQEAKDANIEVVGDSDWAGEISARRSTTGMAVMRGKHLLRHSSTLQASIGLSSAEAEYYALVRCACYGLGTQNYFHDWNLKLSLRCHSDSSSARSFAKRGVLRKQRHVMTRFLWLQERVRLKHLVVVSIPGKQNPADVFTKALTKNEIMQNCERLGVAPC